MENLITVTQQSDIKDIAKAIKQQLKKEFPQCVFSINIERYSMGQSMSISLMAAPFDAILGKHIREVIPHETQGLIEIFKKVPCEEQYGQINHYTLKDDYIDGLNNGVYLSREAWELMKRAYELTTEYNWDKSDTQTDYFNVNYYVHMNIGKWDKPFIKNN